MYNLALSFHSTSFCPMRLLHTFTICFLLTFLCGFTSRSILGSFEGTTTTNRDPEQRFLSLTVTGNNGELELEGMAGYSSGRSAAPDFSGKCYKTTKQYHFTFEDSFGNKGFGTLTGVNDDILFSATITTLKDSRCVPLYHSIIQKRKNNGHQFD